MKTLRHSLFAALAVLLALFSLAPQRALAADGGLDPGFTPPTLGTSTPAVSCVAVQPDGKIIIGGFFSTVNGVARNNLARLHPNGTLDADWNPNVNNNVGCVLVQPDGMVVFGGSFNQVGGQSRNGIARVDASGALDSWAPNADSPVSCMALQADGKILVGGSFFNIGGAVRLRIARLDGTTGLADSWNPSASGSVLRMILQADGNVVIGGAFTLTGAGSRNRLARLDGTTGLADDWNPNAGGTVNALAMQADGKVIVGGQFTTVGGQLRSRIARVDGTTGAVEDWNPGASSFVGGLAVQADGKILAAGNFTTIGGQTRSRIARLDGTTGAADDFNPSPNFSVNTVALQADGKVLIGGNFTSLTPNGGSTVSVTGFARLENAYVAPTTPTIQPNAVTTTYVDARGTAANTISQVGLSSDYVEGVTSFADATAPTVLHNAANAGVWYASGSGGTITYDLGATYSVSDFAMWGSGDEAIVDFTLLASNDPSFATSQNVGTLTFTNPGIEGSRSAQTWNFPSVRARYFRLAVLTQTSTRSMSIGEVVFAGSLSTTPEIAVEAPADVQSGGARDFGVVNIGGTSDVTFTIRNTGGAALNLTGSPDLVAISGDTSDFSITAQPAAATLSGPAGATTFDVRFAPTSSGAKAATLTIASNDADEGAFTIALSGTGDAAAPDTAITLTEQDAANAMRITFEGSDDVAVARFEGSFDGGATWETVTSPLNLTDLRGRPYAFWVRAVDTAGNVDDSPATHEWIVLDMVSLSVQADAFAYSPSAQTVTLSAMVLSEGGSPVNEGTVVFRLRRGPDTIGTSVRSETVVNGAASVIYTVPAGLAAGPISVDAAFSGGTYFLPSGVRTLNTAIGQAGQTITFPLAATAAESDTIALAATATSGLAVSYSIVSGPGEVSGNTLSFTGLGDVTVRASQEGDTNYSAAPDVDRTIVAGASGFVLNDDVAFTSGEILINVLNNDESDSPLPIQSVTQPASGGTVSVYQGKVRFTPTVRVTGAVTFTYQATDGSQSGTATVTVEPLGDAAGTYVGLLRREDDSIRGRVVLTATSLGLVTGSLRVENRSYTLRGGVNHASLGLTGPLPLPSPLAFQRGAPDSLGQPTFIVTLPDSIVGQQLACTAERSPYTISNPTTLAGLYTMLAELPGGGEGPAIAAAMTCKIASNGTVTFTGKTASNVTVVQGGRILEGGRLPFYIGTGAAAALQSLSGEIQFASGVASTLRWQVPAGALRLAAGVDQDYDVTVQPYTAGVNAAAMFQPAASTATLTLTIPSLGAGSPVVRTLPLTGGATRSVQRVYMSTAGGGSGYVSFIVTNGYFSGVRVLGATTKNFFGVVLNGGGMNEGRGVLLDTAAVGEVTIAP